MNDNHHLHDRQFDIFSLPRAYPDILTSDLILAYQHMSTSSDGNADILSIMSAAVLFLRSQNGKPIYIMKPCSSIVTNVRTCWLLLDIFYGSYYSKPPISVIQYDGSDYINIVML